MNYRTMAALVLALPLLALATTATPTHSQQWHVREARETFNRLVNVLDDDEGLVLEDGNWGILMGVFTEDEEKAIDFDVTRGDSYQVIGAGADDAEDLDICVYDHVGSLVDCDTLLDAFPIVGFIARASGTYTAVLSAPDVDLISVAGIMLIELR